MTPLGFQIQVDNSEATTGLNDLSSRLNQINQQVGTLYEGPAREMRIRSEVSAMVKELAIGANPLNAFVSMMDRLSESFKFALPAAIGVSALVSFGEAMVKARADALKWLDTYSQVMSTDLSTASDEQIEKLTKAGDEAKAHWGAMGFWEWLIVGNGIGDKVMADQQTKAMEALDMLDQRLGAKERASAQSESENPEIAAAGKVANIRLEYEEKIREAREKNEVALSTALAEHEEAAIDQVAEHQRQKDEERVKRETDQQEELLAANMEGASPSRTLDYLKNKADRLNARVDADVQAVSPDTLTDKIAAARAMNAVRAEERKQQKEADDASKKQADETTRLKQEVLKQQFEEMSQEEKTILLRQEQGRLLKELGSSGLSEQDQLKKTLRLGDVSKDLQRLTAAAKPTMEKVGLDSFSASGGRLSGVNYNMAGIPNEAAARAEKQRDQMSGYLKTISMNTFSLSNLDTF